MLTWRSVWSPLFQPSRKRRRAELPVGRRPIVHRPRNRCLPAPGTGVRLRSAAEPPPPARRSKSRTSFAAHRLGKTVIRAVTGLGIVSAGTARFAALDGALGHRAAAH